ncbi:hypothetical protein AVEN_59092-1 [Araneus ventricosus]|uniref:Uncharacterized protein n=1 Tax=Araneus ventricosus TaxID=182803 RepID=A0A4Y2QQF2_ARAVE|nr:hypothetical protein AVEN_59092-1 [Araneus ventricosus]
MKNALHLIMRKSENQADVRLQVKLSSVLDTSTEWVAKKMSLDMRDFNLTQKRQVRISPATQEAGRHLHVNPMHKIAIKRAHLRIHSIKHHQAKAGRCQVLSGNMRNEAYLKAHAEKWWRQVSEEMLKFDTAMHIEDILLD